MSKVYSNIRISILSVCIVKALSFITSLCIVKALEPAEYGAWLTYTLIFSLVGICHFGTTEAYLKQYPYYIGMGQKEKAEELENNTFGSCLLGVLSLISIGGITCFYLQNNFDKSTTFHSIILIASSSIFLFSFYFYQRFSARQDFGYVAFADILRAFLNLIFYIGFVYVWRLDGLICGMLLVEISVCVYISTTCVHVHGYPQIWLQIKKFFKLIAVGLPITCVWWTYILQASMDRIISISFLGQTHTGYYGYGVSIASLILLIPMSIGKVIYPRVNEKIAEVGHVEGLFSLVVQPARFFSIILPAVVLPLNINLPFLTELFFQKYIYGVDTAQILILSSFFCCLTRNAMNFIIAINKQYLLLVICIMVIVLNSLLGYLAVVYGFGIRGLAVSTYISQLLLASTIWFYVYYAMGYRTFDCMRETLLLLSPCFLCSLGTIFMHMLMSDEFNLYSYISLFISVPILLFLYCFLFSFEKYRAWFGELKTLFLHRFMLPSSTM